jgi:hypothetical protein
MAQAIIKLGEHQERILAIIKGKYGFKNKSDAVNFLVEKYEEELEPELRPEYIEKLSKRRLEPTVKIKNFEKHFGLN